MMSPFSYSLKVWLRIEMISIYSDDWKSHGVVKWCIVGAGR